MKGFNGGIVEFQHLTPYSITAIEEKKLQKEIKTITESAIVDHRGTTSGWWYDNCSILYPNQQYSKSP